MTTVYFSCRVFTLGAPQTARRRARDLFTDADGVATSAVRDRDGARVRTHGDHTKIGLVVSLKLTTHLANTVDPV